MPTLELFPRTPSEDSTQVPADPPENFVAAVLRRAAIACLSFLVGIAWIAAIILVWKLPHWMQDSAPDGLVWLSTGKQTRDHPALGLVAILATIFLSAAAYAGAGKIEDTILNRPPRPRGEWPSPTGWGRVVLVSMLGSAGAAIWYFSR